jgi:outer membrane immunogenic protein
MRSFLLGGVASASLALSGQVLAADLATKAPPPAPPPGFNWSGLYIGGNVGGIFANTKDMVESTAASPFGFGATAYFPTNSPTAVMGGGQIGYNVQVAGSSLVFGVEAGMDAHSLKTTWNNTARIPGGPGQPAFLQAGDNFTASSPWEASLLVRLGYAFGPVLPYIAGGITWTHVDVATNSPINGGSFNDSGNFAGGTMIGGIEFAVWGNMSLAVEGRYTWYGNQSYLGGPNLTQTQSLNTGEVLGKLNWRF